MKNVYKPKPLYYMSETDMKRLEFNAYKLKAHVIYEYGSYTNQTFFDLYNLWLKQFKKAA